MTLRPNDYDRNGDIIPDSVREEKGDLISREALKTEIQNQFDHMKMAASIVKLKTLEQSDIAKLIFSVIDNAPAVEPQKVPIANVTFDTEKLKELTDEIVERIKSGEIVLQTETPKEEKSYAMGYQDGLEDGLNDIRPHGHWIGQNKDCRGYCDSFKCSECGALIYPNCVQTECDYPSCPFCLTDMRGEDK